MCEGLDGVRGEGHPKLWGAFSGRRCRVSGHTPSGPESHRIVNTLRSTVTPRKGASDLASIPLRRGALTSAFSAMDRQGLAGSGSTLATPVA